MVIEGGSVRSVAARRWSDPLTSSKRLQMGGIAPAAGAPHPGPSNSAPNLTAVAPPCGVPHAAHVSFKRSQSLETFPVFQAPEASELGLGAGTLTACAGSKAKEGPGVRLESLSSSLVFQPALEAEPGLTGPQNYFSWQHAKVVLGGHAVHQLSGTWLPYFERKLLAGAINQMCNKGTWGSRLGLAGAAGLFLYSIAMHIPRHRLEREAIDEVTQAAFGISEQAWVGSTAVEREGAKKRYWALSIVQTLMQCGASGTNLVLAGLKHHSGNPAGVGAAFAREAESAWGSLRRDVSQGSFSAVSTEAEINGNMNFTGTAAQALKYGAAQFLLGLGANAVLRVLSASTNNFAGVAIVAAVLATVNWIIETFDSANVWHNLARRGNTQEKVHYQAGSSDAFRRLKSQTPARHAFVDSFLTGSALFEQATANGIAQLGRTHPEMAYWKNSLQLNTCSFVLSVLLYLPTIPVWQGVAEGRALRRKQVLAQNQSLG